SDYPGAHGKTGSLSPGFRHRADYLWGFIDFGQEVGVNLQLRSDDGGPAALSHIEEQSTGGIGNVNATFASQAEANVVLRQEHGAHMLPDFGLVLAHPQQLGKGESGQCWIGGELNQSPSADSLGNFPALFSGALITPDDGRAQYFVFFIEQDCTVHLAGEADSGDRIRLQTGLRERRLDCLAGCSPPV